MAGLTKKQESGIIAAMTDMKVEQIPIDNIKLNPANPRKNDESVEAVVNSIKKFGIMWPILVRRANHIIIAGNTRYKAFQALDMKTIPVIYHDKDEIDAEVYAVFDNKSSENTPWDFPMLADYFVRWDELGVDLPLSGFPEFEIKSIVDGPNCEPEPDGEPPQTENTERTCPKCGHKFKES